MSKQQPSSLDEFLQMSDSDDDSPKKPAKTTRKVITSKKQVASLSDDEDDYLDTAPVKNSIVPQKQVCRYKLDNTQNI